MSLNALVPSSIVQKASSSAAAPVHQFVSSSYAGLSSSVYDEIIGTGTIGAAGTLVIPMLALDIPSAPYAAACLVEAWQNNSIAAPAVAFDKVVGTIAFGAPPTLTVQTINAAGAIVLAAGVLVGFRLLLPRKVV
jgi:hypothetical protein